MRFTDESQVAFADSGLSFEDILESMGRFNDEMISAGILVAAEGLDDATKGVVVDYSAQPPVVTDGPYGETKELFGGFWILDVASQEEAAIAESHAVAPSVEATDWDRVVVLYEALGRLAPSPVVDLNGPSPSRWPRARPPGSGSSPASRGQTGSGRAL